MTVNTSASKSTPAKRLRKRAQRISSIPDPLFGSSYIQRSFGPGLTDWNLFDYCMLNHENVLIEGPTGNGKTSATMGWAADRQYHYYSISSNVGIEPSQLFGKFNPSEKDEGGEFVWVDGPVTDIVRHGGVLLINEINFVPARIATVLFSLLDKRREIQLLDHNGEVITAHPDLMIFGDMNPDYEGTQPLNKALRNRFAIQIAWDYDEKIETQLVKTARLVQIAGQFRQMLSSGTIETPVSTNMLFEFEKHYEYLGYDFAALNFINHFSVEERASVAQTLDAHAGNLKRELEKLPRKTPYGHDYMDKELGEYGKDWTYDDNVEGEVEYAEVEEDTTDADDYEEEESDDSEVQV